MSMTLTIADDLARQLQPYESQFREILELGIRQWQARHEIGYAGINDVFEKLATLPEPAEVLALRPTLAFQTRLNELLDKNAASGLTADDRREWEQFQYAEHLVRMAKISATRKLQRSSS